MSIDSELSDLTHAKESTEIGQDPEDDWGVVVTEILHYQDEPRSGFSKQTMAATPKKKGDTKGLSTACTVNVRRGIWKIYKFGSLVNKLCRCDFIWRGKIAYQSYNWIILSL